MKVNVSSTKLKGTVLFTVVSVLMVLIVILLGTLALAATASNRAYQNYQKEQTEYTARALLDSVVTAINTDTTNDGIKAQIAGLNGEGDTIDIEIVRSDNTRLDAEGNPVPEVVTVTKLKSQYYYIEKVNPDTSKPYGWQECNVYDLSTIVSKTMADTVYSVRMTDMPITTPGGGGGGGAFVSMGNAVVPDGGVITGGTAVGLNSDGSNSYNIQNDPFVIEVDAYFKGNLTIQNKGTFRFTHMGSHVAVTGDMGYGNNIMWEFSPTFKWDGSAAKSYQEIPCFFVGGKFYNMQDVTWDTKNQKSENGHPVNLYCGYLELDKPSNFFMTGDIYAFNEDSTSVIKTVQRSSLYKWTSKNIGFPGNKSKAQYKFGSFYSAGSALFQVDDGNSAMEIGGDCRVAKNLDCAKNVTVDGDVVVGDTLTVGAGATLTVQGDIYASNLSNYGNIVCSGNIYVFTVLSQGTCNKGEITPANTAGMTPIVKTVWVEDVQLSPVSANPPYNYTYSYTEYTKEGMDETSKQVSATVDIATVNDVMQPWWFNNTDYATVQEAVELYDQNYIKLMEMMATQGQKTQVNTFDISILYKDSIYPEGFDKASILKDIIKEPENYTPAKYSNYPQTLDSFKSTFGMSDASPTYTSCNDLRAKTGGTGIITQSCTLSGSWGAGDDNIYIKANGKIISVVIDGLSMDNLKSIVIDESNGGEVNFFVNKDKTLSIKSYGSILTTDIIKQFESGPGPGHGPNPGHGDRYTDEYFLRTNFASGPGGGYGFSSMKTEWDVKKYADPLYPDVYVFGGENSKMEFPNASALAINVRAPLLMFTYDSSGQKLGDRINYTDELGTRPYHKNEYIAMVGQLIAGDINVENNFGMLHMAKSDPNAANPPAPGGSAVPEEIYTLYYDYY